MGRVEERSRKGGPRIQHGHFEGVFRKEEVFGSLEGGLLADIRQKMNHTQLLQKDLSDLEIPLIRGTLSLKIPHQSLSLSSQIHHIGKQLSPPLIVIPRSSLFQHLLD